MQSIQVKYSGENEYEFHNYVSTLQIIMSGNCTPEQHFFHYSSWHAMSFKAEHMYLVVNFTIAKVQCPVNYVI